MQGGEQEETRNDGSVSRERRVMAAGKRVDGRWDVTVVTPIGEINWKGATSWGTVDVPGALEP